MKKKTLILAVTIFFTGMLSAKSMYVQPNFGVGFSYNRYNAVGVSGGMDMVWKVWEHDKKAAGTIYVGGSTGLRYWFPTSSQWTYTTHHVFTIPALAYGSYEFKVNAGPLSHVGPFFSPGVSFNISHRRADSATNTYFSVRFNPSFGGILVFNSNWILKQTFSWGVNPYGLSGTAGGFIIEAGYRF